MKFDDLLASGQLKKEKTSKAKLVEFITFAENELTAAAYNVDKFPLVAYKSAYDALLHAGNALIRSYGYRPTAKYTHKTITDFVERTLGKDSSALAGHFKRMRRKRHPLQYEAVFSESKKSVKESIKNAEALIKDIEKHIQIYPDAKRLF